MKTTKETLAAEIEFHKEQLTKKEKELMQLIHEEALNILECSQIKIFINGTKKELIKRCFDEGYEPLVFGDYGDDLVGYGNYDYGCVVGVKK